MQSRVNRILVMRFLQSSLMYNVPEAFAGGWVVFGCFSRGIADRAGGGAEGVALAESPSSGVMVGPALTATVGGAAMLADADVSAAVNSFEAGGAAGDSEEPCTTYKVPPTAAAIAENASTPSIARLRRGS